MDVDGASGSGSGSGLAGSSFDGAPGAEIRRLAAQEKTEGPRGHRSRV